jgi:hypothetical protein
VCSKCAINRPKVKRTKTPKRFIFCGKEVARPERVELPTFWFVAKRSIQLSYGRPVLRLSPITSLN